MFFRTSSDGRTARPSPVLRFRCSCNVAYMLLTTTTTAFPVSCRFEGFVETNCFLFFFSSGFLSVPESAQKREAEAIFISSSLKACAEGCQAWTQVAFHMFGLRRRCWRSGVSAVYVQCVCFMFDICLLLLFIFSRSLCCRALVSGNMWAFVWVWRFKDRDDATRE